MPAKSDIKPGAGKGDKMESDVKIGCFSEKYGFCLCKDCEFEEKEDKCKEFTGKEQKKSKTWCQEMGVWCRYLKGSKKCLQCGLR